MEANLVQQLTFIEQSPLYGIFVNLLKAYGAMDRGRFINTLKDTGVGPKTIQLIENFWEGRISTEKPPRTRGAPSKLNTVSPRVDPYLPPYLTPR